MPLARDRRRATSSWWCRERDLLHHSDESRERHRRRHQDGDDRAVASGPVSRVAPRRHVGSLGEATPSELADMMALARRVEEVFRTVYRPDGINLGMNLGKSAGAGVADHIHLHLVPRWNGDTNFMTVVGEVRVIPEEPAQALARLRPFFDGSSPGSRT